MPKPKWGMTEHGQLLHLVGQRIGSLGLYWALCRPPDDKGYILSSFPTPEGVETMLSWDPPLVCQRCERKAAP